MESEFSHVMWPASHSGVCNETTVKALDTETWVPLLVGDTQ